MNAADALQLYALPLPELAARADRVRRDAVGDEVHLCTIINAKSGRCREDCKFCAQSAHHDTGVEEYPLLEEAALVEGARRAAEIGSHHFGIVTSGCALDDADVVRVARAIRAITQQVGMQVCASLGTLTRDQLARLRDAGLVRYHHNIESSRRHYPRIVSTHTFDDRLRTIADAKAVGISVCSGGIIGMGEAREDRIDMALTLRDLNVDAVPINILNPIPGTALEAMPTLSPIEALKTVAIFRILLPGKTIKLAAGRETVLRDFQGAAFMAGANSMIIGGYLTQRGRAVADDQAMIEEIRRAWTD